MTGQQQDLFDWKGRPMQLAQEVKTFFSACEHILSAIAQNRPLTPDEAAIIEYYCAEIHAKIAPLLPQTVNHPDHR